MSVNTIISTFMDMSMSISMNISMNVHMYMCIYKQKKNMSLTKYENEYEYKQNYTNE